MWKAPPCTPKENNLFASTHREYPMDVVGVKLVSPVPLAIAEIEVGSLGTP